MTQFMFEQFRAWPLILQNENGNVVSKSQIAPKKKQIQDKIDCLLEKNCSIFLACVC